MSDQPPPLPGYHRDRRVDDDWDEDDYRRPDPVEVVTHEWNWPAIATILAFIMFGLPVSLMLWTWWWPW